LPKKLTWKVALTGNKNTGCGGRLPFTMSSSGQKSSGYEEYLKRKKT